MAEGSSVSPAKPDGIFTGLKLKACVIVAWYGVRFALRTGGGIITLLVILLGGLTVGSNFADPVERMLRNAPGVREGRVETKDLLDQLARSPQIRGVVQWITGSDEAQAEYLVSEKPAVLSAIFMILLLMMPFVACIGSFNQTAGDIGSRGLRYLLLRTPRPNVFLGRFLGTTTFAMLSVLVVTVLIVSYVWLKMRVYPGAELVAWGAQGFLAMLFVALPYVALCALVSSRVTQAFLSLTVCLIATGLPLVFFGMIDGVLPGDQEWLMKLVPWGWKYDLLSHDPDVRGLAFAVMSGFMLFFLWLGALSFHRRDV